MTKTELLELLKNGENSRVEFKRDDVRPEALARDIAGLLNLEGGRILLGVEDDASVSGLTRTPERAEEWVMEAVRTHVQPAVIPYWEKHLWDGTKRVDQVDPSRLPLR
jgi:ATP-dependent DNA helicase RecG